MEASHLFSPLGVGKCTLQHRVVMAPMTRRRALDGFVPNDLMRQYYEQRASTPGTLLITEATAVSPRSASLPHTPGLWTAEQIEGWKQVTSAVHARGSFIYVQVWMCGRAARPGAVKRGAEVISPSDVSIGEGHPQPRQLSEDEIQQCIEEFRQGAINAIEAGFDGVELHGANGYIIDQFTQDVSNHRDDKWGGSTENRARFGFEVAKAVANAIGSDRVAYRVSPWSRHHGMRMEDPIPQFTYLVKELRKLQLSYLHIVEARVQGNADTTGTESIDFLIDAWDNISPVVVAGGYNSNTAREVVDENHAKGRDVLVAFGRPFVSNPDLPLRIKDYLPIAKHNRELFYEVLKPEGYIDYSFYSVQAPHPALDRDIRREGIAVAA
ncbi:FMN-linked oxidoreductase [Rhizodiscina lignyota]|uniref:FMN-linked oxidoreductase n=1 Tax=Rhizodiscina lignyota TaxID=1504668 RepID=A0A9P4I8R5_9PEZI|nr:FMN-linked oxidoreductase [Rhizodiscina lignyota]